MGPRRTANQAARAILTAAAVLCALAPVAHAAGRHPRGGHVAAALDVRFTPSTALGGANHVTWGLRFQTTAAIPANGQVTISLPGHPVFTPAGTFASMLDLSTGTDELAGAVVSGGGSSIAVLPRNAIAAGDEVVVELLNATNPASGTAFSSISVSPSGGLTDTGTFTANAQPVSELTFSPSTTAAGATGVTWGFRFRLSSTGRLPADSAINVTAPSGGTFGAGGFRLFDLTTSTDLGGGSAGAGTGTAAVGVGGDPAKDSLQPGDLVELEFYGATNPAAGVAYSSAAVTTSADTVAAHPGAGAFTAAGKIAGVTFTASSAAGGATANWGLAFTTSSTGRLLEGASIVVGVPAGATFPANLFQYTVLDLHTGASFHVSSMTSAATQITLGLSSTNPDAVRAGDTVALDVQGVSNPSGGVTAAAVSVSTSSDPSPVPATVPASSTGGSVAGLKVWQTTPAAGATGVVWGAQFATSATGGLTANSGTITFTARPGTFTPNPFVILQDLTTGSNCLGICLASVPTGGGSITVTPRFTVSPGDLLELEVIGGVNPAAATYPNTDFGVVTSADKTTGHPAAGLTFTPAQAPADVSVSPSTPAATATHTAWRVSFTASPTGGIANDGLEPAQIQLGLPAGSVESIHDFAVYDLTTGAFQEFAGAVTAGGASFFTPAAISPGDVLDVVLIGVKNPAAGSYPGNTVTISTSSDTPAASPAGALDFSAPNLPSTDLLRTTDPSQAGLLAELTASPSGELAGDGGRWGSITLTGPAGTTFSSGACVLAVDMTTGDYFPCHNGSAGGSALTFMPGFSVGRSDVVAVAIANVTRAGGLTPPAGFRVNTSSDDGAPSVSGDLFSGTEGAPATGPVLTINGSCPATGTIGWGDGSQSAATVSCQGLTAQLNGTHTYREFGSYTTSASADDGSHGGGTATLADAPLGSATPVTGLVATAGTAFAGTVAHFTDTNPFGALADYSATIDWGDATTSPATISASASGFAVAGTHTYAAAINPSPVVRITINDAGGSTVSTVESLTVNAPGAPAVTLTQPANASTTANPQPTFSGAAGTAPSDAPQVTVNIYAGGAVSTSPVLTLTTTASAGSWSVTPTTALSNGTYTAQAQQSTTTGIVGYSAGVVFTINAPAPPPPPPPTGAGTGGGPPAGCQGQVTFGIIAARGCLQTVVDPSQIPAAETGALCSQLKLAASACTAELKSAIQSPSSAPLLSQAIVRVNGLDITPGAGAVVLLDPKNDLVVSSNATVQILGDQVSLYTGALTLDGTKGGDVPVLDVNTDQIISRSPVAAAALNIGGWPIHGTLGVSLTQYATTLTAYVALPHIFGLIGGSGFTVQAVATADNQQDVQFNELYFGSPSVVNLGGFKLQNLAFCFQNHISDNYCQPKTKVDFGTADPNASSWNITAKVTVLGVVVNAVPPPPTYGLGFVNGSFAFAGASATFPAPGVQIATEVFLNSVGGSLALNPTQIRGTIGLTAGTVTINGAVFMVVPDTGQPYTFTGAELGTNLIKPPLALPKVTVGQFAIAAGGAVSMKIPALGGNVPLANGYVLYAYPSYVAAGGGFNLSLFGNAFVIDGGIQGAVNFGTGQFDIEGQTALIFTPVGLNLQAAAVVSNVGIAGCGSVSVLGHTVAAGLGYKWGQGLAGVNPMWGSCDLTPYQVAVSASAARTSAAGAALRVPGGLPNEMVKLIGQGGAPDVTITGPGGVSASTSGQASAQQAPFLIERASQLNTTYIAILHPRAGRYAIRANPGSPAITQTLEAHGFTTRIRAHVTGHRQRRLVYSITAQPGQRVTFVERGQGVDRLIGATRLSHGSLSFTAAPGPGGVRQIIASVTVGGYPVVLRAGTATPGQVTVTSYRAPGLQKLGRARGLQARRSHGRLLVSFHGVRGARHYAVVVSLRSGLRNEYVIRRPRLRETVPTVGPPSGTVTVWALGDDLTTTTGAAARAKITLPSTSHRHHRGHHRRKHH